MIENISFYPFGQGREGTDSDPDDGDVTWTGTKDAPIGITSRGFTGHLQLDLFGLVHMQGRLYDYNLGRFISPDPYVQDPYNSQCLNRYSYCLNNPLKYVDPSGYGAIDYMDPLPDWALADIVPDYTALSPDLFGVQDLGIGMTQRFDITLDAEGIGTLSNSKISMSLYSSDGTGLTSGIGVDSWGVDFEHSFSFIDSIYDNKDSDTIRFEPYFFHGAIVAPHIAKNGAFNFGFVINAGADELDVLTDTWKITEKYAIEITWKNFDVLVVGFSREMPGQSVWTYKGNWLECRRLGIDSPHQMLKKANIKFKPEYRVWKFNHENNVYNADCSIGTFMGGGARVYIPQDYFNE